MDDDGNGGQQQRRMRKAAADDSTRYQAADYEGEGGGHVIGHGNGGKVIPAKMARLAESQSLE